MVRASISSSLLLASVLKAGLADEPLLCDSYTPGERCLSSDCGWTLKANALYWTVRENHLTLGITLAGMQLTDQIPPELSQWDFLGETIRITPKWDWGYRVGLGYTTPCDYWDLQADWTSFHTQSRKSLDLLELPAWNPWGYPDTEEGVRLFDLRGSWNFQYDLLNLEFGRAFWIGRCLTFRPHFGATCGWIDQALQVAVDYQPQNFTSFGSILALHCDFTGYGLNSGFTLHFTSGTGLGVYGKIAIALFYGSFDSSLHQTEEFANAQELLIASTSDHFQMGIAGLQALLGINWNHTFCCDRFRFGIHAQWEFNEVNDLNKFHHYSHFLSNGIYRQEHSNLMLMGLTIGGSFDF